MKDQNKVELTKQQAVDIVNFAEELTRVGAGLKVDKKLAYALAYNQQKLMAIFKGIQAEDLQDKAYTDYDKARIELAKQLAKKDKDGNPVANNGRYVFENQGVFEEKHKELRDEHRVAIDARLERMSEMVEPVGLHMVRLDNIKVKSVAAKMPPGMPPGVVGPEGDGDDAFVDGSIVRICLPFIASDED